MTRRKPKDTPVLHNFVEVNAALEELGGIDREVRIITAAAEEDIDQARAKAKLQTDPLERHRKALEAALEQYAVHNKNVFGRKRSRRLTFGTIGWRKGTGKFKPLRGWTWEKIVGKLDQLRLNSFLRRKVEADKEALEKAYRAGEINNERLERFGLKWTVEDEFYYELKAEDPDPA